MTTSLDLLKQTGTVVVSDSGDFECMFAIAHHLDHALIFWLILSAIDVYKPQVDRFV